MCSPEQRDIAVHGALIEIGMLVALEHAQLHLGAVLIVQIVLPEAHVQNLAYTVSGGQDPERSD